MQYIGARYVPRFSEPLEWQENLTYEPLTIVTRSGNSYTSKKAVPVGIDPFSNSEYWACTGSYNAQIEEYKQQVIANNEKIATVLANFTNLETSFTKLETTVNSSMLTFQNVPVPVSAFSPDSSFTGYNYCASIILDGVKAKYYPEVVFSVTDAMGGNFSPVSVSYDGGVKIYSEAVPGEAITIPTIICWRVSE